MSLFMNDFSIYSLKGGISMFEYLKPHQSFQSVEQMDEHVDKHLKFQELTKSEQRILRTISQHALATPGAAHLKAKTIAEKLQITTKTVYRAVSKLQQIGVLKKLAQTKMNGIKGANIYVICPYVPSKMSERAVAKKPEVSSVQQPKVEVQSFSFQSSFSSNKLIVTKNEWHEKLINLYTTWPINEALLAQLEEAIVQLPIENAKDFDRAKWVIQELVVRIQTGLLTVHSSFKALVLGAYKKWFIPPTPKEAAIVPVKRPVPFYDWLTIRESN